MNKRLNPRLGLFAVPRNLNDGDKRKTQHPGLQFFPVQMSLQAKSGRVHNTHELTLYSFQSWIASRKNPLFSETARPSGGTDPPGLCIVL